MKFLVLASSLMLVIFLTAGAAPVGGGVPAAVHYIDHDKVAAMMAKGGAVVEDPGLRVLAQRRGTGPAEWHDHTNHIFIVVEGEATIVTGGKLVDAKRTAADQMQGTSIEGGETHHLTKGDIITIPAKTPHWWKEIPSKTIAYYGVNIESE
jgi:quercetin dioxygenase-like cupin family protein